MKYQAFISYKHASSSGFAERLELAIKAYAKPIWRPPAAIFRDEKYLRPGADLPQMIRDALAQSEFLVYLASPEAAQSPWVVDELTQWCANPARIGRLILVLTSGTIALADGGKTIDWDRTDALPGMLRATMPHVPLFVDCTTFDTPERQSLLDPDFKKAVNAIVAAFRGIDPIEMSGQEVIQYRKNIRNRNVLVGLTALMLVFAAAGGSLALRQTQEAARQARVTRAAQLASEASAAASVQLPQRALLLGAAAAEITNREKEGITQQAEQALRDVLANAGGRGLSGHKDTVSQLHFLRSQRSLLSVDRKGRALLWTIGDDGRAGASTELIADKGRISAVQFMDAERRVRFVTQRGDVVARDIAANAGAPESFSLKGFDEKEACETKSTATTVLQVSNQGVLQIWDLTQSGSQSPSSRKIADNALSGCAISEDGRWIYVKADDQVAVVVGAQPSNAGERLVLAGTKGSVVRTAFSPHGRQIAAALADGTIAVWDLDAERGKAKSSFRIKARRSFRIPGKKDENLVLGYSRSGQLLVAGGESGLLRFWRMDAGAPRAAGQVTVAFEFYRAVDGRLSFERNDTMLIASDGLRAAAAIDLRKGIGAASVSTLHNHPSRDNVGGDLATPYAIHPKLALMVTAGDDHFGQLWSFDGPSFMRRTSPLRGHDERIVALAFSTDGNWLATSGYDQTIRLWPVFPAQWFAAPAVLTAKPSDAIQNSGASNPSGGVRDARFILGEEWFESSGDTPGVRLGRIDKSGRLITALALESDESFAAFAAKDEQQIRLWSSYRPLHRQLLAQLHARDGLPPPEDDALFALDRGRRMFVEAMKDGTIRSWDVTDGTTGSTLYRGLGGPIIALDANSRSGIIAAIGANNQLAVWRIGERDTPKAAALATLVPKAMSADSRQGITGKAEDLSSSPSLRVLSRRWLWYDYKYLIDLDATGGPTAWRLPEGAHETRLLGCCIMQLFDDTFSLWSVGLDASRPSRLSARTEMRNVTAYDYHAERRRLVVGQMTGRVAAIDFDASGTASEAVTVASHDFAIRAIALSSDARIVAAGSRSEVTMTHLSADKSVARHVRLKTHGGDVRVLRFSPSDTWLLSGGEDEVVHVHPVSAERVLELACGVVGRSLSDAEAERIGPTAASGVCKPASP